MLCLLLCLPVTPPAFAVSDEPDDDAACFTLGLAPVCISETSYTADVCSAISTFADHWQLPEAFFARLIWQESRFDPQAISPAGAQGIAQFMAGTARLRALADPFDPAEALARSAEYLRFLEGKYGNLGLAAAAYNSGEGRISRFVNAGGGVPFETRDFVRIITGRSIDYWIDAAPEPVDYALHPEQGFHDACIQMAAAVPMPDLGGTFGSWQPWGVLIAQNFSRDIARQSFQRTQTRFGAILGPEELMLISVRNPNFGTRTRFSAMVGRQTRQEAEALCARLRAAGGQCIVQRNRS
ncbi:hypothetical protein VW29_01970 [Devosia limi DSM 17137]|uniref:Transglycosylase SLT domain-containing protein n=1 Tax=Devosia limi DSM 17137 TaxID=1121477 RepID=A0A0F5LWH3_9HYPH|nr:hypothetical protein VW29_01970 [Devosia limi DSM 17137]